MDKKQIPVDQPHNRPISQDVFDRVESPHYDGLYDDHLESIEINNVTTMSDIEDSKDYSPFIEDSGMVDFEDEYFL